MCHCRFTSSTLTSFGMLGQENSVEDNIASTTCDTVTLNEILSALAYENIGKLDKLWRKYDGFSTIFFEEDRKSILHLAVEFKAIECCSYIVKQQHFNINVVDVDGLTCLDYAVTFANNEDLLELLLKNKADILHRDACGLTTLEKCIDNIQLYKYLHDHLLQEAKSIQQLNIFTLLDDISLGLEKIPIPMMNFTTTCDVWSKVSKFCYVKELLLGKKANEKSEKTDKSIPVCSCTDGCMNECPCVKEGTVTYEAKGMINIPPEDQENPHIYSCCKTCSCINCGNNAIESGVQYPVGVYFVSESMGFDLRSEVHIPRGAYVGHYAGELLTYQTALDLDDDSFLFELPCPVKSKEDALFINAKLFGNFCRFINHSCNPNLTVIEIKRNDRKNVSNIAFYANSDIDEGYQLTFDYGDDYWKNLLKKFNCRCNYEKCKYSNILESL